MGTWEAGRGAALRCAAHVMTGTWLTVAWGTMVATAAAADFSVNSVAMCSSHSWFRSGAAAGGGWAAGAGGQRACRRALGAAAQGVPGRLEGGRAWPLPHLHCVCVCVCVQRGGGRQPFPPRQAGGDPAANLGIWRLRPLPGAIQAFKHPLCSP